MQWFIRHIDLFGQIVDMHVIVINCYDISVYHYAEVSFQVQHGIMFMHGLNIHDFPHTHIN